MALAGRLAIISGGLGGLGAAIGSKLHSQGAKLALLNAPHEAGRLGYLLKKGYNLAEPTEDIRVYECDVTKEESVQASFEEIKLKQVSDSAEPTILVNSSGYISLAPLETMPIDEIQKNIDVNLLGPILLSRSFFHLYMTRKQATGQTLPGRIVSLASQAALIGIKDHAAYCSAKSGLLGLHKCMALDWGPHGITANTISPGVIMTEMGQKAWANEEARDAYLKATPTRVLPEPEEIAELAAYLVSDLAKNVTGTDVRIEGGFTAH